MKKITGFAVINADVGKKVAFTYSEIDGDGNITKSNIKESYVANEEILLNAIATIETNINTRITE